MMTTRPIWLDRRVDGRELERLSNAAAMGQLRRIVQVTTPAGQRPSSLSWWARFRPIVTSSLAVAAVVAMYLLVLMRLA